MGSEMCIRDRLIEHAEISRGDGVGIEQRVRAGSRLGAARAADAAVDHDMRDVNALRRQFARRAEPAASPDSLLDPDAIAATYLAVLNQPRSAWTHEIELRPWVEKF